MALTKSNSTVLYNCRIIDPSQDIDSDGALVIVDGKIGEIITANGSIPENDHKIDCHGAVVAPGIIDMRVFTGEPGNEHRETLESASLAAAAGGVTTIITMPDTNPVIDDSALVDFIRRRARDTGLVRIMPMAAITKNIDGQRLSEFALLKQAGAIAFSDGRNSIANSAIMRQALLYAKTFDSLIVHHCVDQDLRANGVMNQSKLATRLGLAGVPKEAEIICLERDLRLVSLTGAKYHAALISCKESLDAMRDAKQRGLDVTCSVSINHLCLNENDIGDYRTFFKLSPPLRCEADRLALVGGVANGDIDIIVSCHDPQDVETKRHPFAEAADGAIGLETMLSAGLRLVNDGGLELSRLLRALCTNPAKRLRLNTGSLRKGAPGDCIVIDLKLPWVANEHQFRSKSKNSPFEADQFTGRVVRTIIGGQTVYSHTS